MRPFVVTACQFLLTLALGKNSVVLYSMCLAYLFYGKFNHYS